MKYFPLDENISVCPLCNYHNTYCLGSFSSTVTHIFQFDPNNKSFYLKINSCVLVFHPEYGYRIDFSPYNESIPEINIPPFKLTDYKEIIEKYSKLKSFI